MRLTLRQLHNLPVETVNGQPLGRVVDVEMDVGRQEILCYHVSSRKIIPGLFEQKLLIDRKQIVSLTAEKMVVEDAVRGVAAQPIAPAPESQAPLTP